MATTTHTAAKVEPQTVGSLLRTLRRAFSSKYRQCENARFVVTDVPLHAEAAQRMLPWGLRLTDPPKGLLFVVDYRKPVFTAPYYEAGLLISVRTWLGQGYHCCWMVVNRDTPMIFGRETLAYPKKMAHIEFSETGDTVTARVERKGVEVLRLQGRRTGSFEGDRPIFGAKTFNAGGIGQKLGLCPIWTFRLTEMVREAYTLELEWTLGDALSDPLQTLIAGPPEGPRLIIEDIAGARYLMPCGITGPRWFARTFPVRFH